MDLRGMSKALSILLIGVGAVAAGRPAQAVSLVNGNFETVLPGELPADWTITGPANANDIAVLTGADYTPCCGAFGTPAQLANHFVAFGSGNVPNVSTLSQSFATVTGQSYTVTFDAGGLGVTGAPEPLTASVLQTGGGVLNTMTVNTFAIDNLATTFTPYTLSFIATSDDSTVAFNSSGAGIGIDSILDNVAVTATPIPAALPMLGAALATVAGVGWRKARRRSA